ncbi:hypothetical protein AYO44_15605 [Planctomycetaceae bacterium SCGC AG-212-F19]|nr:hypothetical protein AYO44_15605 [Planctomycetaceae bacterium SCGC AG-212-F19]
MNPIDRRLQLDLAAARYLEALERDDFAEMAEMWRVASDDDGLESILREVHAGLLEEHVHEELAAVAEGITAAVEGHLPSAEIVRQTDGPVTVGDVADELYRHSPDRLPINAHLLNERLRGSREPLPEDLGLSMLTAWAESRFGPAPPEYWRVFRQAAVKLVLRCSVEDEYRLAARRTSKPEGKP